MNLGGLKLSLYALRGHPLTARSAIVLYETLCQADQQMSMVYKDEFHNHVKSNLEYLEIVGDIMPHMRELCG